MSENIAPFEVGDKIICVNDEPGWVYKEKRLCKGEVYLVTCPLNYHYYNRAWEVFIDPTGGYWDVSRFRKVNSAYTDATAEIIEKFKPFEGVEVDQPIKIKELETQN